MLRGSQTTGVLTAGSHVAIVGGLLFSQVLTLSTTPVMDLAFDRLAQRVSTRRGGRPALHPSPVEAA